MNRGSDDEAHSLVQQMENIRRMKVKRLSFIILSAVLIIFLFGYSLTLGSANITMTQAYEAVLNRYFPGHFQVSAFVENVIWILRMPRIIIAVLAGATLAMAGCVTQATLKNPLATPYTMGVSASAGFGAALGIVLGFGIFEGVFAIIGNAFIFSLIPAAVIILASKKAGVTSETIILCGVAMSYIFGASNTILQFFAEDDALRTSVFWLVGDLTRAAMWQVPYLVGGMAFFLAVNMYLAKDLNLIKMGDDDAKGMGVDVDRVKIIVIITACLATATVISFTGAIGFICLLAPHISRTFVGGDERYLIPASGLLGACLLLTADIIAKTVIAPILLPVGAITALIGGPLLVYLLLRKRK